MKGTSQSSISSLRFALNLRVLNGVLNLTIHSILATDSDSLRNKILGEIKNPSQIMVLVEYIHNFKDYNCVFVKLKVNLVFHFAVDCYFSENHLICFKFGNKEKT